MWHFSPMEKSDMPLIATHDLVLPYFHGQGKKDSCVLLWQTPLSRIEHEANERKSTDTANASMRPYLVESNAV